MRKLLLLPAFLVFLVVACNGGEADLTDREITDEELSLMALPLSDLGPDFEGSQQDDSSGFQSSEDRIETAWDEEDEAEDIERFGRVNGYEESYTLLAALLDQEATFGGGTAVELYTNAEGASSALKDYVDDWQRAVGTTKEDATALAADEFTVDDIGKEAVGLVQTVIITSGEEMTIQQTVVGFREGRLMGVVFIQSFEGEDVREEATALARKLDERILAVLRGEVEAGPTATDEPAPASSTSIAPSDVLESFRFSSEMVMETDGGLVLKTEGEFVAPDSLRCAVSASLGGVTVREAEVVSIGDDAWLDEGDGFEATSADDPEVVESADLCPGSAPFWKGFDFIQDPGDLPGQPDTKNGVDATLYSLGDIVGALGSIGFLPPELEGVTVNAFDVWVAEDGGWPVAVDMDFSADAEAAQEAFGLPFGEAAEMARIAIRVDLTAMNSLDISVEPPAE